jgi:BarA-like signal transduction histidine kinase
MVHKKFEGYRNSLDETRQEVFDWLVFEVAGMFEETLFNHHDRTEAMLMNILVEMEMRLRKKITNSKSL